MEQDEHLRSHKERAEIIMQVMVGLFVLLLARLWYLQLYKGDDFYKFSLKNRLRKEIVKSSRGMIFDRNNEILVHNIPRFDVVIIPQYLKGNKQSIAKLAKILNMKVNDIKNILKKNSFQASYRPVTIKKNIDRRYVAIIETENLKMPGVRVINFISRKYRDKEVGGHLFGYISEIFKHQLSKYKKKYNRIYNIGDFIGQSGLEEEFDSYIRGSDGHEFLEVDAKGRIKNHSIVEDFLSEITNEPAIPGNNIRLTIDRDLQVLAYNSLNNKVGSVIAVDINNGQVLAMVSRPSFDPTRFSRGITKEYWDSLIKNENNPLIDRNIQEHYSPGSVFKTITAIAALEEGIVDEKTEVFCKGAYRLKTRKFHCWKAKGHGKVGIVKAIRESCDVYFYKLSIKLDIDTLAKYARKFGLGRKTGIKLPREIPGLIPDREWKRKKYNQSWHKGETLSCSIGQSFILTTPLQLVLAYSAIVNGGSLYRPYVIQEIFSNNGRIKEKFESKVVDNISLKPKTISLIKKSLFEVVNKKNGTAWWFRGKGINMAGKTGTSQVISFNADKIFSKCEDMEVKYRHHGLFTAYAPYKDPKIAVSVIVEHGCHGSTAAAPIARDLITKYMRKYHNDIYLDNIKRK